MECFQSLKQFLAEGFAFSNKQHITPSQGFVLHFVAKSKGCSVKEIAERLYISSSAATQLIDGLVRNGLLVKNDNPDDGRSSILTLTEKARGQFSRMKEHGLGKMKGLFSVLSDEELEIYLKLNRKIMDNLE
jgi:DNA-binding MarR family transcriptional regulator